MSEPTYPECEKLANRRGDQLAVQQFLEFLEDDGIGLVKGYYEDAPEIPARITEGKDSLVNRFLGIDEKKLEAERRAMLESLQN